VLYLLDADTLIKADRIYYPLQRFLVFWEWLLHHSGIGNIKVPQEQFDEVAAGKGELVDWLSDKTTKEALLLPGLVDQSLLSQVIEQGYAPDLDETELITVGKDPFLIAYGLVSVADRTIVSFEVSAPAKKRANRKIPDVCSGFGLKCITMFDLIKALDFTTNWKPPK
jgi:Domain of unknown function (DUF4411)